MANGVSGAHGLHVVKHVEEARDLENDTVILHHHQGLETIALDHRRKPNDATQIVAPHVSIICFMANENMIRSNKS